MPDQLKMLMDYTIFHIGLYTTLSTMLIGFLTLFKDRAPKMENYLVWCLVCFVIAGVFGGLIGSSIPYHKDFESFSNARLGPWFLGGYGIPSIWCTYAEHTAFWLGIGGALIGLCKSK